MSSIEPGTAFTDTTDDSVDELLVLDVARGTAEIVEPVDKSSDLAGIYDIRSRTYRHRTDDLERLEFQVETGDLEPKCEADITPFVEAIDG